MVTAKRVVVGFCCSSLLLTVSAVEARDVSMWYEGSDALASSVEATLSGGRCGKNIHYLGRGDGQAESLLEQSGLGLQQTAPMSIPLSKEFCDAHPNASQLIVGQDDVVFARTKWRDSSSAGCGTSVVSDIPGYTSNVPTWAEAMQLIYGGVGGKGTTEACSDSRRKTLVENWYRLWSDGCATGDCSSLRFAFRPGDGSGIVRIMQETFGIERFCNGEQGQDLDPLRTDCSFGFDTGGAEYCPKGTLGVVQPIVIPPSRSLEERLPCEIGQFTYAYGNPNCLDETSPFGGLYMCQFPMDCKGRFGCINTGVNGSTLNPFIDGRVYNHAHLDRFLHPISLPAGPSIDGRPTSYNHSSLFFNGRCPGGSSGHDDIQQVGCLVDQVDCSIGFGGRSMLSADFRAEWPTDSEGCPTLAKVAVQPLKLAGASYDDLSYPVPRKRVYLNTRDVPAVNGKLDCSKVRNPEERAFCECMNEDVEGVGFVGDGVIPVTGPRRTVPCGAE